MSDHATPAPVSDVPRDPSPGPFDDLLDRVTRRLRVDPELQLEVRQELRSHLEESAAQFRAAGRSDADARDEAVRALGDPNDLTDQLWRANRRRIRLRAAAVWAGRLVLPPLAVALIALLGYNAAVTWSLSYQSLGTSQYWIVPPNGIARNYRDAVIAAAPPETRRLFELDDTYGDAHAALARELSQAYPDDPALYAFYAAMDVNRRYYRSNSGSRESLDGPELAEALTVLAEGERRDPGNALYPMLSAAILFDASARDRDDASLTLRRPGHGEKDEDSWARLEITDPARFAQALDLLHRAAAKPYLRSYAGELLDRKLKGLPVHRLADVWLRVDQEISVLLPTLNFVRRAASCGAFAATDAAMQKRGDEARRLVRAVRLIGTAAAIDAAQPVEMMVATSNCLLADQAEARVRAALGDEAGADAAWKDFDRNCAEYRKAYGSRVSEDEKARAGILYASLLRNWTRSGGRIDAGPMRRAEYIAADQLGAAAVSTGVLVLAALYAFSALLTWLRRWRRPETSPRLRLFIGWRRALWIIAVAAVAPLVVYLIYARLTFLSGRAYGLNVQLRRIVIEYGALAVLVMLLLMTLTTRAIRARAAVIGLPAPAIGWRAGTAWRTLLAFATTAAAAGCLVGVLWVLLSSGLRSRLAPGLAGVLLLGCWGMIVAAAAVLRGGSSTDERTRRLWFGGVIARSAFPIIALAAVILVGSPGTELEFAL